MTEKEYRALSIDSYSSIKVFLDDRKAYFRRFVLGQPVEGDPSQDDDNLRIGGLVDCLLFTPDEVSDRYIITSAKIPTKQMLSFVNNLYNRTIMNTDEDGILTKNISDLIVDAYHDTKYDRNGDIVAFKKMPLDKLKEEFLLKKIGYDYYLELRNRQNKVVITDDELARANRIVSHLKMHKYTMSLLSIVTSNRVRVLDQYIVLGNYRGLDVKCMSDRIIIDEDKKIVTPYDLKTTWNTELFDLNYLKYRYYIQNTLYVSLLQEHFKGYTVSPMSFIVTDKFMYMDPLIYETSEDHLREGREGFEYKGIQYVGLDKAVDDILYHKQTGVWGTSANLQKTNGIAKVKLFT